MNFVPLFSIFVVIATGFFAKKIGLLEQKHSIVFVDFVLCFAIPALIFDKIYHVNVDTSLINTILAGFSSSVISAVIAFGLGVLLKFSKATTVSMIMLSLFGNTLFVGMPVAQGFFGDEMLNEVIFYDQLATSIPLSILGPLILSFGAPEKVSLFQNAMKILKFPPFIALIIAFAVKGIYVPEFIFAPFRMLEGSVTPVALFAIGVGLSFGSITSSYKSASIVLICKMVLPALIFFIIMKILGVSMNKTWLVGLFQCCMPPMVLASAMVIKAGLDSSLAISSVALGVAFSFVTLPALFYIFGI
ncbi:MULTISPECIES: AEC family transporter [Campylobacter]|uniref:Membrane protein, predicted permease n=1 Tax=Campylobacter curvus (strain 525.92) TaxID=360105 RepID=A7GY63_CAMC5|nr:MULTISPECIES: AEC family transporter [Campylobacter]EAU00170.1 putative membrane protein, predicted permease [Campylobacter curvus 525.92]EJP76289.1 transporter, auxin efflux carrier domain protein [Campylobacter sp. FOBRC14]